MRVTRKRGKHAQQICDRDRWAIGVLPVAELGRDNGQRLDATEPDTASTDHGHPAAAITTDLGAAWKKGLLRFKARMETFRLRLALRASLTTHPFYFSRVTCRGGSHMVATDPS